MYLYERWRLLRGICNSNIFRLHRSRKTKEFVLSSRELSLQSSKLLLTFVIFIASFRNFKQSSSICIILRVYVNTDKEKKYIGISTKIVQSGDEVGKTSTHDACKKRSRISPTSWTGNLC